MPLCHTHKNFWFHRLEIRVLSCCIAMFVCLYCMSRFYLVSHTISICISFLLPICKNYYSTFLFLSEIQKELFCMSLMFILLRVRSAFRILYLNWSSVYSFVLFFFCNIGILLVMLFFKWQPFDCVIYKYFLQL